MYIISKAILSDAYAKVNYCIKIASKIWMTGCYPNLDLWYYNICGINNIFVQDNTNYLSNKYYHYKCFDWDSPSIKKPVMISTDGCIGFIEKVKAIVNNTTHDVFLIKGEMLGNMIKNLSNSYTFGCKLIENCTGLITHITNEVVNTVTPLTLTNSTNIQNTRLNLFGTESYDHKSKASALYPAILTGSVSLLVLLGMLINHKCSQRHSHTNRSIELLDIEAKSQLVDKAPLADVKETICNIIDNEEVYEHLTAIAQQNPQDLSTDISDNSLDVVGNTVLV